MQVVIVLLYLNAWHRYRDMVPRR